ncbi:MAG TPA: response regulator [Elusimicrobiales bacterium]|nr:response regulator [Elusimicrobiales bacterium]
MPVKLLLVDDEEDLITLLRFVLEQLGFKVSTAPHGKAALELLDTTSQTAPDLLPDVIITDVMMPEMDGFSFVNALSERDYTMHIPVIIMTAKGKTRDLFQADAKVAAFIEKPFEPKKLKELVDNLLKK